LTPNGLLEDEVFLSRDITKLFLDFLGAQDQGDSLAIAVENTYMGKSNMGNLTAMVPGIIDVRNLRTQLIPIQKIQKGHRI
jgi:DUF917 family protein